MRRKERAAGQDPSVKANFIYNSLYQIFAIIIPLVTMPYLSRTLGAGGMGEYAVEYAVASYFMLFIKLGVINYGGRQIAYARGDREKVSREFWEIYFFQMFMMLICGAVYLGYCGLLSGHKILSLFMVMYVISAGVDITWFFWGMEEFKLTVRRDFIIKVISTACIFLFVKGEGDTWKYTLFLSAGFLVSQILLWPSLKRYVDFIKPTKQGITRHIKPNFVLFVPTIAVSIYKTMDKIMLGAMSNTVQVGYYQYSENIVQVPLALIGSLGTVMQPRMANMISRKTSEDKIEHVFFVSIILAMFLSTLLGFGIMTVSPEFVPLFYGPGFETCITIFQLLLPSCFFLAFANVITTQHMIPRKKDKEYVIALFSGAVVNLVLNCLLIPQFQAVGAAMGTLAAEAAVCVVKVMFVRKELLIKKYILYSAPFIFAGLIMYVVWLNVSVHLANDIVSLVVKIIGAGLTYLASLFLILLIQKKTVGSELDYIQLIKGVLKKKR